MWFSFDRQMPTGLVVVALLVATGSASALLAGCSSDGQVNGTGVGAQGLGGDAAAGSGAGADGQGGAAQGGGDIGGFGGAQGGQGGLGQGGSGGQGAQGGGGGSTGNAGDPCSYSNDDCNNGLYCNAPGCAQGTCKVILPKSAQLKNSDPQCGCDGISFYNPSVAESFAMSIAHTGACGASEDVACHKTSNPCSAGYHCNAEVANAGACFVNPNAMGSCWAVPLSCDANGPKARGCVQPQLCHDTCSLIQSENQWHPDASCT